MFSCISIRAILQRMKYFSFVINIKIIDFLTFLISRVRLTKDKKIYFLNEKKKKIDRKLIIKLFAKACNPTDE